MSLTYIYNLNEGGRCNIDLLCIHKRITDDGGIFCVSRSFSQIFDVFWFSCLQDQRVLIPGHVIGSSLSSFS